MKSFLSSAIVNIARVEILTDEDTPRLLCFDTVSSAELEPFVSKGEETELRVKNTIIAQNFLEDIVKGYNITLKDAALSKALWLRIPAMRKSSLMIKPEKPSSPRRSSVMKSSDWLAMCFSSICG